MWEIAPQCRPAQQIVQRVTNVCPATETRFNDPNRDGRRFGGFVERFDQRSDVVEQIWPRGDHQRIGDLIDTDGERPFESGDFLFRLFSAAVVHDVGVAALGFRLFFLARGQSLVESNNLLSSSLRR